MSNFPNKSCKKAWKTREIKYILQYTLQLFTLDKFFIVFMLVSMPDLS
jgi:hypothetical protein